MMTMEKDYLTAAERERLSDNEFGLPSERRFPLVDARHVRAAESYFRYASDKDKPELARNILRKANEFGVHVSSPTVLEWAEK